MDPTNYNSWTKLGLVKRVHQLEAELQRRPPALEPEPEAQQHDGVEAAAPTPGTTKPKVKRKMDPTKYSTRFIALKLAYLGKNYGGFEFQAMCKQPTIEEELWNALTKACLIFPEDEKIVDFNICEYSKCGRTDRGVSAFGQVIGIRVRSNKPLPREPRQRVEEDEMGGQAEQEQEAAAKEKPFDPIADEIPYPMLLNRLLPPDIRILAWCPSPPPDFSARFSCRERQYRYFFTQPAFSPEPSAGSSDGAPPSGWLDIDAMRDAAKRFEGEQDFRNLCKVDPAKLITNWKRTIFESDIVEVEEGATALPYITAAGFSPADLAAAGSGRSFPKVYYFHVRGSAFLWHQIRHMVAVLFLVGQRLERPEVVSELLDVEKYPGKPGYPMADEVPLVLWDCVFPDLIPAADAGEVPPSANNKHVDSMQWIRAGAETSSRMRAGQFGPFGALDGMWKVWRGHKMDELLSGRLLQLMAEQAAESEGEDGTTRHEEKQLPPSNKKAALSVRLYEGGNTGRPAGKYVPMEKKDKLESPDELNDKYARRKGFVDAADMRARRYEGKDVVMQDDE
ncbi:pseudouridylate synthase 3 [Cordyceps fumosorosea ARSEF 2679]|uniref:Pseudouridylate synthase 3 n=1 Tax=Cordyceps fumosorosea (strain ARSEF 2679) TaxID=1081104 RepID=A0A167M6D6_CORFA|nr:pseudouridylate synthase 3 [Cordyceps fumosorosea ARSEF 2679]OAA53991.1 pseudouridylate synthase 3 [Cordyceps fumosorosea ARSEF 2679]